MLDEAGGFAWLPLLLPPNTARGAAEEPDDVAGLVWVLCDRELEAVVEDGLCACAVMPPTVMAANSITLRASNG